ncbi:KLH40-like protein [Mya arenaria]|uniref:KLH40-like protein n=1 Tax=Mya arenaria TaxID=6604 RepID=A0ABY7DAH5_MYAAR|nr:kelch-like protein 41 [Mya arenaria]WAQ94666.1 KLH40-like protein [Mya arenaria]
MDDYREHLLSSLYSLMSSNILTDVTFRVNDVDIFCHRNVLAASSSYFRAMFTSPVIEKDEAIIPILNIDPDVFRDIIGYVYTGDVKLTNENVQDILVAGSMFELPYLIGRCSDHMINEICQSNCVEVFLFASHYSCLKLKDAARNFIQERFSELLKTQESIFDLSFEDFEELVESDDICVDKEETVFEAIIKWIDVDKTRVKCIGKLFKHVRLALTNFEYIKTVIEVNEYIKDDVQCADYLKLYNDYLTSMAESSDHPNCQKNMNLTQRYGMFCKPMLIFSGGGNTREERSLTAFDPVSHKNYIGVTPHPTFDFKCKVDHFQLVTVDMNKIYFLGGIFFDNHHMEDHGQALNEVLRYNMKKAKWESMKGMQVSRCCFSATVVGKNIYTIGGKSKFPRGPPTDSVELYDTDNNTWISVSPLPVGIYSHTSIATKDAIFLFGGKDEDDDILDTVFRYDVILDSWTLVTTQMPKPRAFATSFTFKSQLYVIGGASFHENMLAVLIYDSVKNKWSYGEDFPEERKIVVAEYHDGNIFVCGGVQQLGLSGRRSRQVESRDLYKYDITDNTWTKLVKLVQYGNTHSLSFAIMNTKYLDESDFISTI